MERKRKGFRIEGESDNERVTAGKGGEGGRKEGEEALRVNEVMRDRVHIHVRN